MVQHHTSTSPLLELPTELRFHIYDQIGPRTRPDLFPGVLLSCRTLYYELEPELRKTFERSTEDIADAIRAGGDDIHYTPPTNLQGWLNLTVSRPKKANMFHKRDPYLRFKYLYFHKLTITFHNDAEGFEFRPHKPDTYQRAARRLAIEIGQSFTTDWFPAMKRWILDWSDYPQADANMNMGGPLLWHQRDAWEMETSKSKEGLLIGACFQRVPGKTRPLIDEPETGYGE